MQLGHRLEIIGVTDGGLKPWEGSINHHHSNSVNHGHSNTIIMTLEDTNISTQGLECSESSRIIHYSCHVFDMRKLALFSLMHIGSDVFLGFAVLGIEPGALEINARDVLSH